jgi:hypothetical protein
MNKELQAWLETQFQPWQKAVQQAKEQRAMGSNKFRQNIQELQKIVGLLLDGRVDDAVKIWNRVGFTPQLSKVEIDSKTDSIMLIPLEGEALSLPIDQMLSDVQTMVSGQGDEVSTSPVQADGF